MQKEERHKWTEDQNGKYCHKCGSRVNNKNGLYRYMESDRFGVIGPVNWYPRCFPFGPIIIEQKRTKPALTNH